MDPDNQQRLRKNYDYLKQNLNALPVADKLYSKGFISEEDLEDINARTTQRERCHKLLDCIKRSDNKGYETFREILKDTKQSHLLRKLDETDLDIETKGQPSDVHIFFDPSEDFELKGLIDELTVGGKISTEELERMKHYVTDEYGCPEEIMDTKNTPQKFLRHLMKTRLLSRYNLAFLQSLLWRVGNKTLCQEIANFARQNSHQPIHFHTPKDKAENGYSYVKFHIRGNFDTFKSTGIEDIVMRISRYLGVPSGFVIPAGIEPSESLLLTLMIRNEAVLILNGIQDLKWLSDLDIDYLLIGQKQIDIPCSSRTDQTATDCKVLESQIGRLLESERHLKQCLFDEQMSSETLKAEQETHQDQLRNQEKTIEELNTWYSNVFLALMVTMHLLYQTIKARGVILDRENTEKMEKRYVDSLKKAKQWSSNHQSLIELIDATREHTCFQQMSNVVNIAAAFAVNVNIFQLHVSHLMEQIWTMRQLGGELSLDEIRQGKLCQSLLSGEKSLEGKLQEVLRSLASRLDDEARERLYYSYNVPRSLQTPDLRNRLFEYIILSELEKSGKYVPFYDDIEKIMEDSLKVARRKALWEEYKAWNNTREHGFKGQMDSQNKGVTDITDRLDKIEKMIQTIAGQNAKSNLGFPGSGFVPGFGTGPGSSIDDMLALMKGQGAFPFGRTHTNGAPLSQTA